MISCVSNANSCSMLAGTAAAMPAALNLQSKFCPLKQFFVIVF